MRFIAQHPTKQSIMLMSIWAVCLALGLVAGCKEQGPAERAGESVDRAVGDAKDATQHAGKAVEDAVEDAGDALEDATDEK